MKQTAVEWLINIIDQRDWINYTTEERLEVFEQAKEMENQQKGYSEEEVKQAYTEGGFAQLRYIDGLPYIDRDRWFEQNKNK